MARKIDKARSMWLNYPHFSAVQIARHVGCSTTTVYKAREHFEIRDRGDTHDATPTTDIQELVTERGKDYGHPLDNFMDIAVGKMVVSKCKDAAVRHALEMIWLKVCRLVETPDHADSIDDIAGYAETIRMIHAERERRGAP